VRRHEITERNRPYQPVGAAREFILCKDPEVLLCGPAGTGKSRAALEKLHLCAEKYAGCRLLIIRKTRASLTETGLVTYERDVLPEGHPAALGPKREHRHSYKYPNGSEIVVGGMDKPSKTLSTEYDIIYVQEATELSEDEWETLTRPLRNGVIPYQQIIADCNPAQRTHWLKLRCDAGRTRMIESRHEDNPLLYDRKRGEWTERGRAYIAVLDRLTGVRYLRLRKGLWVSAEGIIYDEWDATVHVVNRFPIPADWRRYWVIDFGFTNPFVWQAWAEDPDGRLYRYREIYKTRRTVAEHAQEIKRVCADEPRPVAVICDHDAEDRATFTLETNMSTVAAIKMVSPGIQAVKERLKPAGDGKPRLYLMRDSLVELDQELVDRKLPTCTEDEVEGYVWDTSHGQKRGEQPVKENDHGCDCMRYLVMHVDRGRVELAPSLWG